MSYNPILYNLMIEDRVRTEAYTRAMRSVITPGCTVVDIGTGSGYFAVLACQLGASRVIAIEPDEVIELARQVAQVNRCTDKIEFIQDFSTRVQLPSRADVVICDLRGALPFKEGSVRSIIDARERLLIPGGALLPSKDEIFATFVSDPELYSLVTEASSGTDGEPNLLPFREPLRNTRLSKRITREQTAGPDFSLGNVDYRSTIVDNFSGEMQWTPASPIVIHGFCAWFDTEILPGITFSNSPDKPDTVYGRSFFPFAEAVTLGAGDSISLKLDADMIASDYVWRWETRAVSGATGNPLAGFRQSSLLNIQITPERLRRSAADYVPRPTDNHEMMKFVLDRLDGTRSLGAIAAEIAAEFPTTFARGSQALTFVGEAVEKSR